MIPTLGAPAQRRHTAPMPVTPATTGWMLTTAGVAVPLLPPASGLQRDVRAIDADTATCDG